MLCDVTHQMMSGRTPTRYIQIYKYRWASQLCRSLTPHMVHPLRKWQHYKPLKARCLRHLNLLETSRFWGRNVQKSLGEISGKLMSHIECTLIFSRISKNCNTSTDFLKMKAGRVDWLTSQRVLFEKLYIAHLSNLGMFATSFENWASEAPLVKTASTFYI